MVFIGIYKILKVRICACDYEYILGAVKKAIEKRKIFLVSPIASQTLVRAFFNSQLRFVLNKYDELYPDSQWVKRAILFLYGRRLKDRVYGPTLMKRVCALAEVQKYRIFLYGTTGQTLRRLVKKLNYHYTRLQIAGTSESKFASLTTAQKHNLISFIESQKTNILLIALGSPLEQEFCYSLIHKKPNLTKPIVVLPVGAAFDFIAGIKPQAPRWMQEAGLEWFYRFCSEPARLWYRYFILGPLFILFITSEKIAQLFNIANSIIMKRKIIG